MALPPQDSTLGLPLPLVARAGHARKPSPVEEEVIVLFDQLRDRLLRYLLSFGLSVHDGEEIIQEVFLALFQHLQRGKPRHNLRSWVFRVGHNLALKHRQSSRRNAAGTPEDLCLADTRLNPEQQLVSSQRQERLQAVLGALPEQDRLCLCLRAEGLRYREITEILGMSLGSVSVSLVRSLARLSRADER